MQPPTADEVAAQMADAGITGIKPDDLAWLVGAAAKARAFALPPDCAADTPPAAVFVPLGAGHD